MPINSSDLQHELMQTAGVFGRLKETNLVFEGEEAYTDGKNIVLPAMPLGVDIDDERARVMRGYLDHEAGHIRHSDFDYLKEVMAKGISPALKDAWNSTEDIRLEARVIEEYEGSEKNLGSLAGYINQKEYDFIKSKGVAHEINIENVTCAVRAAGRITRGPQATKDLLELFPENVQGWAKHWAERCVNAKDDREALQIALDIMKKIKEDPNLESKPEDEQPGEGEAKGEPNELTADKAKAQAEAMGEGGDPEKPREYRDGKDGKGKGGKVKKSQQISDLMKPSEIAKDIFGGSGTTFGHAGMSGSKPYVVVSTINDETYHRSKTPKNRVQLHSMMQTANPAAYEKLKTSIGGHVNTMKSRIKRSLAAMELRDWSYGRQDGRIDSKRLVAASQGAENVYKKRADRMELDTSVHMLIDLSGSMSGSKMQTAAKCAVAFSECLEGSPIQYQVSGFSNRFSGGYPETSLPYYSRSEALQTYVFKSFDESLHMAKSSLGCLPEAAGGNNSDADAIYWAYNQLKSRSTKRKVLLVFSDGQPANATHNVGYDHLNFHAKKAIEYVQSKGVEVIGIGIETTHLKNFYSNFVEIQRLEDLAGAMFNKLSNALIQGKVIL